MPFFFFFCLHFSLGDSKFSGDMDWDCFYVILKYLIDLVSE